MKHIAKIFILVAAFSTGAITQILHAAASPAQKTLVDYLRSCAQDLDQTIRSERGHGEYYGLSSEAIEGKILQAGKRHISELYTSILRKACADGNYNIIKIALEKGGSITSIDYCGRTPFDVYVDHNCEGGLQDVAALRAGSAPIEVQRIYALCTLYALDTDFFTNNNPGNRTASRGADEINGRFAILARQA